MHFPIILDIFLCFLVPQINSVRPVRCTSPSPIPDAYVMILTNKNDAKTAKQKLDSIKTKTHKNPKNGKTPKIEHLEALNFVVVEDLADGDLDLFDEDLIKTIECDSPVHMFESGAPSWGLDRILSSRNTVDGVWRYPLENQGDKAHIYVLDTGIQTNHTEFADRVEKANSRFYVGSSYEDDHGHGTHCAGIAAGTTYGVAPKARLHAVKVLDQSGSGTVSNVARGVDFVTSQKKAYPSLAIILSLSLGTPASLTLDNAVITAIGYGVVAVVAAGNSAKDACDFSPARVDYAITVGAIDQTDARAYYSNYGNCVDIYAPGSNIKSSYLSSSTSGVGTLSGTSMATPHISGLIGLILSKNTALIPRSSSAVWTIKSTLLKSATLNVGTNAVRLAYHPCSSTITTCCTNGVVTC